MHAGRVGNTAEAEQAATTVVLLVSADCQSCKEAERIWRPICVEFGVELECVAADGAQGAAHIDRLELKSLPVLLIKGEPAVAGVPTLALARQILQAACVRAEGA